MKQYLLRLDDACPTMHKERWAYVESLLDKYGIKPMVGIIPHNKDPKQILSNPDPKFWDKAKEWENKGWAIALHGYDHCYISHEAGINPLWNRSEFAGVPLDKQKEKISKGIAIFCNHGIEPTYFFAPSHTFDLNTLEALKECSSIRMISDTIANKPYKYNGFIFIPQMGGHCSDMKMNGIWTFCLHPSVMSESQFTDLEQFLKDNHKRFISFMDIDYSKAGTKNLISRLLSSVYFGRRKLKKALSR